MKKPDVVRALVGALRTPVQAESRAYAPVNIALCKYWGKRDEELNLPVTSSLSISLADKGTHVTVSAHEGGDLLVINGNDVPTDDAAARRMSAYLDLFRPTAGFGFAIRTRSNIPMAAGLASSASAFASLAKALDGLFGWGLDGKALSILSRMGSGSASRSVYDGFVEWHVGTSDDGMDSYAEPLEFVWPDLRVGLLTISDKPKEVGSREAMKRTKETCELYEMWPIKVANDLIELKASIRDSDFSSLGKTSESNALAMHATMVATWPPVLYWHPESIEAMRAVWSARREGLEVYFTMDAGPNLKLLFEATDESAVRDRFAGVDVVAPFPAQAG